MTKAISTKEFLNCNIIYFHNIMDGLKISLSCKLQGDQLSFYHFLKEVIIENGIENSYCDFYYNRLKANEKEYFYNGLTEKEKIIFHKIDKSSENIYYYLTEEMLEFTLSITVREWMFTTFYFSKIPCTLWGNYNLDFPFFFKTEKEGEFYKEIAVKNQLQVTR